MINWQNDTDGDGYLEFNEFCHNLNKGGIEYNTWTGSDGNVADDK